MTSLKAEAILLADNLRTSGAHFIN